jgi:hypothetical protein
MRVQTLERMRRLFVLVLMAALFVYHVAHDWPQHLVLWLRRLGGKLGLTSDLDGPNILLAGISAVFVATATLAFAAQYPFPRAGGTCGKSPKKKVLTKRCICAIICASMLDAGFSILDSGAQKRPRSRPWASLRLLHSICWLICELTDKGRCMDSA